MKRFVVLVAWVDQENRAYSILSLDDDRRPVDISAEYVGNASQTQTLRQWLSHVKSLLDDGGEALVYTNHVAVRTKREHVSDYPEIHCMYKPDYRDRYSAAMQTAIRTAEKGKSENENGN